MTANAADTAGVLHALARILEHAHARLGEGYPPDVAIVAALAEHRPSLALARLARAAWSLALREGGPAVGQPRGAAEAGDTSATMAEGRGGSS